MKSLSDFLDTAHSLNVKVVIKTIVNPDGFYHVEMVLEYDSSVKYLAVSERTFYRLERHLIAKGDEYLKRIMR